MIVGPHGEAQIPDSGGPLIVDLLSGKGSGAAGGAKRSISRPSTPHRFPQVRRSR